jgi:hypothetical protein
MTLRAYIGREQRLKFSAGCADAVIEAEYLPQTNLYAWRRQSP